MREVIRVVLTEPRNERMSRNGGDYAFGLDVLFVDGEPVAGSMWTSAEGWFFCEGCGIFELNPDTMCLERHRECEVSDPFIQAAFRMSARWYVVEDAAEPTRQLGEHLRKDLRDWYNEE